MMVVQEKRCAH